MFISFESIDGLGKSTQSKLLRSWFEANPDLKVYSTKEPGDEYLGSSVGKGIRNLLFYSPTAKKMAPGVADLLFLADHIQNSFDIQQKLDEGYICISDRYADSQFAYAAASSKQAPAWAMDLYVEQYGTKPDFIIFLKAVGLESGWTLDRAKSRTGPEAGKQEGKPWNNIEEQIKIQEFYESYFNDDETVITIEVEEHDSILDVTDKIIVNLLIAIGGSFGTVEQAQ